ncbi:MAG TPA: DUF2934 domain-containing protein [Mesorhizobium sp.]|jgi:hypothetical protein|nr:DUF2934 domain-containing protein [Mesorhizobium sp.]
MLPNLEQRIRARAHQIWEQNGCVEGCADEHWRMAEREVAQAALHDASAVLTAVSGKIAKSKTAKARSAPRRAKAA